MTHTDDLTRERLMALAPGLQNYLDSDVGNLTR